MPRRSRTSSPTAAPVSPRCRRSPHAVATGRASWRRPSPISPLVTRARWRSVRSGRMRWHASRRGSPRSRRRKRDKACCNAGRVGRCSRWRWWCSPPRGFSRGRSRIPSAPSRIGKRRLLRDRATSPREKGRSPKGRRRSPTTPWRCGMNVRTFSSASRKIWLSEIVSTLLSASQCKGAISICCRRPARSPVHWR